MIVLAAGGILAYEQIQDAMRRVEKDTLKNADELAFFISVQLDSSKRNELVPSAPLDEMIAYTGSQNGYEIGILDSKRRVVSASAGMDLTGLNHLEVDRALQNGVSGTFEHRGAGGTSSWVVVPVRTGDDKLAGAVLLNPVGALAASRQSIYRINTVITITVLITMLLSVLLGRSVSNDVAGQISGLAQGVKEIDEGNLDFRIEPRGRSELSALAGGFNRMASDLQRSKQDLDRHLAELRESEMRLRLVTLASHDMIWETDLEKGTSKWSETLWNFLGYGLNEVIPSLSFWKKQIHPDDLERYESVTGSAMSAGSESWSLEYRLRRSDGSYADLLDHAYVVYDAGLKPVRLIGAATDITEKKTAERKLVESESSFRLSFENNPHPMFVYDLKTLEILEVNDAFLDKYGYPRDDIKGMTLVDIHPAEEISRLKENLAQERPALQHSGEWRHRKKDGTTVDVQIDSHLLEFMGRRASLVIAQDITRRKEAEIRLRESEIRFRSLIERSSDIVSIIDSRGRIVYMSPAVSRMGFSPEEVVGRTAFDLIHPDDAQSLVQALKVIAASPSVVQTFQMRFRHRDGSWRYAESIARNALSVPEIRGIVVNSRDITEKKKLEAQFLRAQRMESIGTLAGGIAHDLNNVLSPILLSLGVIKRMNLNEDGRTIVETIEASARRGADLIKQVLSFARGIEGERTLVQIRHLIEEVEKIIRETFPKSIEISTRAPRDLWTVSGDATQLHQVMMNLCVNARDAMPDGGRIEITAENLMLDENYVHSHFETKQGPYVVLSVTDTGVGIPPSVIDRIFEPFFTTKEPGKGTGLGLSTVMSIVKSHDGAVYVYSEPGKGTTFKIFLPGKTEAGVPLVEEEMKEKYTGKGELILVVDDEAAIRNISRAILDAYGYRTLVAVDGENGVGEFIRHRDEIALVITDMMMPRMDGKEIVRSIRQLSPGVRMIMISGLSREKESVAETGVKYFLTKPFTAETLLATVYRALSEPV